MILVSKPIDAICIETIEPKLLVKLNFPLSSVIAFTLIGSNVIVTPSKGRLVTLSSTTPRIVFWENAEALKRINKININFLIRIKKGR